MSAKAIDKELERLVRDYSDANNNLSEVVDEVTHEQRRVIRRRMRTIQSRAAVASSARDALVDYIDKHRELFEKPRTRSLHGIKFGLRKQPGKVEGDAATIMGLIRKKLPDKAASLIRTTTSSSLNKDAMMGLDGRELAKVGATIVDDEDKVVAQAAAGDIDKLVEAMLEDVDDEEGGASK